MRVPTRMSTWAHAPFDKSQIALVLILSAVVAFAQPAATLAAGIAFIPGAQPADIHPVRANLSVLTYRVPGGLLVADRLAPGNENRYAKSFVRHYPAGEFFLVQSKHRPHSAPEVATILSALGRIAWQNEGVYLVEIPARNRDRFAARHLDRTHITLDPPPTGWDRQAVAPTLPVTGGGEKTAALIQDFVANFSAPAFFQTIQEISGEAYFYFNGLKSVSTRFYSTSDKDLIADYLASKLTGYGYTVAFDNFLSGSTPCRNIVATRTGTTLPDEFVILGAHYDSISEDPTNNAPGAEDNGSGTASVMEIARIAAGRDFERTVQFVLFDSEEQGLIGSYHFVEDAVTGDRNIVAAITMDMIAYYDAHYAVRIEGETPWEWLMSDMAAHVSSLTDIGSQKDYNSWGSDHVPFQQAGIPAFLAIDYDYGSYPGYHRTSDVWSQIVSTSHIGTQISMACAATLAEVAGLQSDLSAVGNFPAAAVVHLVAYPNPFNPQISFVFSPRESVVGELAVFDITGHRVATLASGSFPAGLNRVSWQGTDTQGRAVSSGTYIGRLQTGHDTASIVVNLVR